MLEVTDYKTAVEVLKNPLMVQALYEKSPVIMADVCSRWKGMSISSGGKLVPGL